MSFRFRRGCLRSPNGPREAARGLDESSCCYWLSLVLEHVETVHINAWTRRNACVLVKWRMRNFPKDGANAEFVSVCHLKVSMCIYEKWSVLPKICWQRVSHQLRISHLHCWKSLSLSPDCDSQHRKCALLTLQGRGYGPMPGPLWIQHCPIKRKPGFRLLKLSMLNLPDIQSGYSVVYHSRITATWVGPLSATNTAIDWKPSHITGLVGRGTSLSVPVNAGWLAGIINMSYHYGSAVNSGLESVCASNTHIQPLQPLLIVRSIWQLNKSKWNKVKLAACSFVRSIWQLNKSKWNKLAACNFNWVFLSNPYYKERLTLRIKILLMNIFHFNTMHNSRSACQSSNPIRSKNTQIGLDS